MRLRRVALACSVWMPILLAVSVQTTRAWGAECNIEVGGDLLKQEVARVPRLVDPRCYVRSSTSGIGLTIVDGRYIENTLQISGDVEVFTRIEVDIPAGCSKGRLGPLSRTVASTLRIATTVLHEVGRVEHTDRKVEAHVVCGPLSTIVAIESSSLVRLVASFRAGGIGVR